MVRKSFWNRFVVFNQLGTNERYGFEEKSRHTIILRNHRFSSQNSVNQHVPQTDYLNAQKINNFQYPINWNFLSISSNDQGIRENLNLITFFASNEQTFKPPTSRTFDQKTNAQILNPVNPFYRLFQRRLSCSFVFWIKNLTRYAIISLVNVGTIFFSIRCQAM